MALTVIPPPPFLIFSLLLLFFPILSLSTANIPSFPVIHSPNNGGNLTGPSSAPICRLELSAELFGGVSSACSSSSSSPLDRSRCCPVLAAWLFAAHARAALQPSSDDDQDQDQDLLPISPDDSQRCVDSLQSSLAAKKIHLPRPNDTCDTVICFCGIRLHQIGSLRCPAAFNLTASSSSGNRTATPTAAVKELESNCRNSSYAGCTRCLNSLQKVKNSGRAQEKGTTTERAAKMFGRDCQLMSLTWLLAKNKTLYIPTVSAVLRAILYSPHPQSQPYTCSPDHENMPLAVDSLQFSRTSDSSSSSSGSSAFGFSAYYYHQLLLSLPFFFFFFF